MSRMPLVAKAAGAPTTFAAAPGRTSRPDQTRSRRPVPRPPTHARRPRRFAGAVTGPGCRCSPSPHRPREQQEREREGGAQREGREAEPHRERGEQDQPTPAGPRVTSPAREQQARDRARSRLAVASAPSPAASEPRTSRANVGKTVRLENPRTSHVTTTSAMRAARSVPSSDQRHRSRQARDEVRWRPIPPRVSAADHEADRSHDRHHGRQDERRGEPDTVEGDAGHDRPDSAGQVHTEIAQRDRIRRPTRPDEIVPSTSAWRSR